jgi:hypothetical protein
VGWFHFRPGHGSDDVTNVELGYRLHRSSWNKGYATDNRWTRMTHRVRLTKPGQEAGEGGEARIRSG